MSCGLFLQSKVVLISNELFPGHAALNRFQFLIVGELLICINVLLAFFGHHRLALEFTQAIALLAQFQSFRWSIQVSAHVELSLNRRIEVCSRHGYFEKIRKRAMSVEQLKVFLAIAKDDSNLQDKLKAAQSSQQVASLAKEYGYEFTADKLSQLSKDELERLAGGCWMNTCWGYGQGTAAAPDWN